MLFTGLGRFVLGETVPSVWVPPSAYGLGRYSRPRAQFLPIRTSQPVNNIHVLGKTCRQNEVNCSWVVILHVPHRKIPGKPHSPPYPPPVELLRIPFRHHSRALQGQQLEGITVLSYFSFPPLTKRGWIPSSLAVTRWSRGTFWLNVHSRILFRKLKIYLQYVLLLHFISSKGTSFRLTQQHKDERDCLRKAREAHLIHTAKPIEPLEINIRDEQ